MLYEVEYSEMLKYKEVYEADSEEAAYVAFYRDLEENDIQPEEVVFEDLNIESTLFESSKIVRK